MENYFAKYRAQPAEPNYFAKYRADGGNAPVVNQPGQFRSGLNRSFSELPGLAAGVGAFAADVVGADSARDSMLEYAKRKNDESAQVHQDDASSITDAWNGDVGWLDFLANSAGYVTGQAFQSVLTGGLGAFGAKMLAKQGIKEAAETAAAKAIAGGATEEAATQAALAAIKAGGISAVNRGAVAGAGAHNFGMELGSIYPDAVDEAESKGRTLDSGDKFRVFAAASLAAGVDTAGDAIMANRVFRGSKAGNDKTGILGRAAREVPSGMAREAGTEAVQTAIEHYGAGQPIADEKGLRDIIDSAGTGAMGGILGGGAASLRRRSQGMNRATPPEATDPPATAPPATTTDILAAGSTDEAIDLAQRVLNQPSQTETAGVDGLIGTRSPEQALQSIEAEGQRESRLNVNDWSALGTTPAAEPVADWVEQARETGLQDQAEIQRERRIAEIEQGPVDSAPRQRSDAVEMQPIDRIDGFIEHLRQNNTPAARAFIGEVDAGRITREEIAARVSRETPRTDTQVANERLAAAAEQAPKLSPDLLLTSDAMPYGTRAGALARANKEGDGAQVIVVPGGFAVRPKEPPSVQSDIPGTATEPAQSADGGSDIYVRGERTARPDDSVFAGVDRPAQAPVAGVEPDSALADGGPTDQALNQASGIGVKEATGNQTDAPEVRTLKAQWAAAVASGDNAKAAQINAQIVAAKNAATPGAQPISNRTLVATPGVAATTSVTDTPQVRAEKVSAEASEIRVNVPQVDQPTVVRPAKVRTQTLDGVKVIKAKVYEVPGYSGPQLAVAQYSSRRGEGYRVYLPKTGFMLHDNNGVGTLSDSLKIAVQRVAGLRTGSEKQIAQSTSTKLPEAAVKGEQPSNSEQRPASPVAESQAPSTSEQGDGEVATTRDGAAPTKETIELRKRLAVLNKLLLCMAKG